MLDWQSLLEGFYFSNQQSNYKESLLGPPCVIWSQWLDHPLIAEWLLNSLGYAAYKLALSCPAVFINENFLNVPKQIVYSDLFTREPIVSAGQQKEAGK